MQAPARPRRNRAAARHPHRRQRGADPPRADVLRRVDRAGRNLAARRQLQGPDRGKADRVERAHVCIVRGRIRYAHDPRLGKDPRRARRRDRRRVAVGAGGRAAAVGRARLLHLWRPSRGSAPWTLRHHPALLPERPELKWRRRARGVRADYGGFGHGIAGFARRAVCRVKSRAGCAECAIVGRRLSGRDSRKLLVQRATKALKSHGFALMHPVACRQWQFRFFVYR
ncbi:hypothetical protein CBM2599_A130113 [Cupriavidus taiwanensis]|nr:hypothetical protein CBM2599_A130113 [Cupriavidus taiwanensis]